MRREQIYMSHLLPDEQMSRLLRREGIGVESIEFGIPDSLDQLRSTIGKYRRRLEEMGAERLTIHGPFLDLNPASYDSRIRRATMDRFAAAYEAARELGAEKVVYHSCMNPATHCVEGWPEQMADFFREFMEDRGEIPVAVENVLDRNPEPLVRFMELTDRPELRLCLDVGHAHCYAQAEVLRWLKVTGPWLSHVHIHDNSGDRDAHLGVGQGSVPWRNIYPILEAIPEITCTIECNSEADVLDSLRYLLQGPDESERIHEYTKEKCV